MARSISIFAPGAPPYTFALVKPGPFSYVLGKHKQRTKKQRETTYEFNNIT